MLSPQTWATGWRGSSTGKAASMCLTVGCAVDRCLIASPCRSTSRNSVRSNRGLLRAVFGVGTVRGRGDGVYYYEVTTVRELVERVFPFFERFPLRGAKRLDLERFRLITALIQSGRHLSPQGFEEILRVRSPMNRGGKRRRSDDELVAALRTWNPQRPYARLPLEAEG